MLIPERLLELSVFVGEQELETVTTTLMREGVLHLDNPESEQWAPDPSWADASETYGAMVARLEGVRSALGLADAALRFDDVDPQPSHDRLDLEGDMLRLETRIGGWQEDSEEARRDVARLEAAESQLTLLRPLGAPLEDLRRLTHYHLTIGTLPQENVDRVAGALFQVTFVLVPLERRGDRTLVAAATAREDAGVLDRALASAFFEPTELPLHVEGLPEEALATVREDLRAVQARIDELDEQRQRLSDELGPGLLAATARARSDLELCEAIRQFPCHAGIYVIAGWIPAARAGPLSEQLLASADGPLVVETLPPVRGRPSVPSLVRNPPWLRPFEPLVTTFGMAGYDELDPTLVAAIVFLFMYGMMFGDMGHGVLLALAGLALRRASSLGTVVAAAGASSTLFGALYGVAFGAEVMHALWLRPLDAIFPLLIAAVAVGAVILNLGFVLNLVSAWRNRDTALFWLDKSGVLGVALYWSLLGGGLAVFSGRVPIGAWLATVAVLATVMWFREPLAERIAGARPSFAAHAVTGFFELFETVIAYLSNSLSFVRLGAFAVAHEGLSSMVLRYGGGPTGWITLVVGTALIVGFEGLIVGIQALRLEYYEFFGRFFQGRGTPFRALTFDGGTDA